MCLYIVAQNTLSWRGLHGCSANNANNTNNDTNNGPKSGCVNICFMCRDSVYVTDEDKHSCQAKQVFELGFSEPGKVLSLQCQCMKNQTSFVNTQSIHKILLPVNHYLVSSMRSTTNSLFGILVHHLLVSQFL